VVEGLAKLRPGVKVVDLGAEAEPPAGSAPATPQAKPGS